MQYSKTVNRCFLLSYFLDVFPVATGPNRDQDTKHFLQNVLELLWNFISESNDRESKVLEFHHPEQLMKVMDFTLPDMPKNLQEILNDCKETLKYQVKTGSLE